MSQEPWSNPQQRPAGIPPNGNPAGQYSPTQRYGNQRGDQPPPAPGYGMYGQQYGTPQMMPPQPPKKGGALKVVAIVFGVIVAVCVGGSVIAALASGDGDDPKASVVEPVATQKAKESAKPDSGKDEKKDEGQGSFDLTLGTTVKIDDGGGAQQVTVRSVKAFKKGCSDFAPDPEQGTYVVVDVLVTAVESDVSVNPLYFEWVADDGTTANALSGSFSGCDKSSLSATNSLKAGQKRAGQIVFDAASAKGTIEFTPGLFSETAASWRS